MAEPRTLNALHYSLNEIQQVASELLERAGGHRVWLFYGDLGTGKTTLIKEICRQLGVDNRTSTSPTFSIINEYPTGNGNLFHFDFYRMKSEREILDLGVEEYFDSGSYCFVEWPGRLGSLMPNQYFEINILDNGSDRTLEYQKHG
jgi:tRNA threonylcarbamoyladenosine biosynthesis protein TsaE